PGGLGGAEGQEQGVELADAVLRERAVVARDRAGDDVLLAGGVEQRQAAPALVCVELGDEPQAVVHRRQDAVVGGRDPLPVRGEHGVVHGPESTQGLPAAAKAGWGLSPGCGDSPRLPSREGASGYGASSASARARAFRVMCTPIPGSTEPDFCRTQPRATPAIATGIRSTGRPCAIANSAAVSGSA